MENDTVAISDEELAGMMDDDSLTEASPPSSAFIEAASLRDRLREQRRRAMSDRHVDLDLPGYDGLVMRYSLVPYDVLSKVSHRVSRDKRPRSELYGECSVLVQAAEEAFGRSSSGALVPMSEVIADGDSSPVRFDKRLARFLGVENAESLGSASICLLAIVPDYRVPGHYMEYMEWHSGEAADLDDDVSGESGAATV